MASRVSKPGPKRPRLSLQTKNTGPPMLSKSRTIAAGVNARSPTSINTVTNALAAAMDKSAEPLTAINTSAGTPSGTPMLGSATLPLSAEIVMPGSPVPAGKTRLRIRVPSPYVSPRPDTPMATQIFSPDHFSRALASAIATPPQSAGAVEQPYGFDAVRFPAVEGTESPNSSRGGRKQRRVAPYSHPNFLHSILRNSPLPADSTPSPRRQSLRLQEKAAKKVGYKSPLEQSITNSVYTASHIDLLFGDGSASNSPDQAGGPPMLDLDLDVTMSLIPGIHHQQEDNATRDGGSTPAAFEDMRRRLANLGTSSPMAPMADGGVRKRKRREPKRRWVWTIGQDDDADDDEGKPACARDADGATGPSSAKKHKGEDVQRVEVYLESPTPTPTKEEFEREGTAGTDDGGGATPRARQAAVARGVDAMDVDERTPDTARPLPRRRARAFAGSFAPVDRSRLVPGDWHAVDSPVPGVMRDDGLGMGRDSPVPTEMLGVVG